MSSTARSAAKPTLRDIARAAQVSVATVSKTLNQRDGVSDRNRERVLRAVESVGYQRREPRPEAGRAVAETMIVTYDTYASSDQFYGEILRGLLIEGESHGIRMEMALLSPEDARRTRSASDLFPRGSPASVLFVGLDQPHLLDAVAALGCPTVIVNGMDPKMRIGSVAADYYFGAWIATRHLIDQGHRDIIHVTHPYRRSFALRLQGFREALAEAGIAFDMDRHVIDLGGPEMMNLRGRETIERHIDRHGLSCTAFFGASDIVALAVMQALASRGISVPDQCSVIGFDDLPICNHSAPPLTSMHTDRAEIGRAAIRMLIAQASNPERGVQRLSLGVDLIERQSVAPPRR